MLYKWQDWQLVVVQYGTHSVTIYSDIGTYVCKAQCMIYFWGFFTSFSRIIFVLMVELFRINKYYSKCYVNDTVCF